MADLFPRSAVGASRPVCDYGWLTYGKQIGQTGKKVSPRLYVACGISGSAQHLAGMMGSEHIVAVNSDPDAPIFRHAHAGVLGDCAEFLRSFIDHVSDIRKRP
jgi:electron transfer flavoprotein alpha subunit